MASTKDNLSFCFIAFRNVKLSFELMSVCIKEVMNLVEGTIIQLIYFMEYVHFVLGKGVVLFVSVLSHNYISR